MTPSVKYRDHIHPSTPPNTVQIGNPKAKLMTNSDLTEPCSPVNMPGCNRIKPVESMIMNAPNAAPPRTYCFLDIHLIVTVRWSLPI